ncbi:hypothetical protein THAOC_16919 [Thalassiosira oceanica]|uniref:Glycolipid transfer protein domain-containing protein n=1 Tax=Thalassiosira oceanica TaxID=159749 RepID=K0SW22_THAOC|nr:hypothetical protein THAOC_16919 [Thalassiosira oceanica]|eukprot:EJK62472.1 hypothetical protein THAOC_16919 [Thalassiosira oceanica]
MRRGVMRVVALLIIQHAFADGSSTHRPRFTGGYSLIDRPRRPHRTHDDGISKKIARRNPFMNLRGGAVTTLDKVGSRIQSDVTAIQITIVEEWGKISSAVRLPSRRRRLHADKLDDVCTNFSAVMTGGEIDTAQLIKACRAHLSLVKSGGRALGLVAKDLECNVNKAEHVFKQSRGGGTLSSLLRNERDAGAHNGSELHEDSAAMGLLWIRRSLAFQCDLYSEIAQPGSSQPPKHAACRSYVKHLAPFHGWMLQKVFPASLTQMSSREAMVSKFAGVALDDLDSEVDREVSRKLKSLVSIWRPLIDVWESDFERLGLEDVRRV